MFNLFGHYFLLFTRSGDQEMSFSSQRNSNLFLAFIISAIILPWTIELLCVPVCPALRKLLIKYEPQSFTKFHRKEFFMVHIYVIL